MLPRVLRPVASGASKRVYRQASQSCCPWKVRFAQELKEPAFAPHGALAGKDARTLARELLARSPAEFSASFKGSPMKRAKRRGLHALRGREAAEPDGRVLEEIRAALTTLGD